LAASSFALRSLRGIAFSGLLRALDHPCLDLFQVEPQAFGLFLRQQRIEKAEPLDEAAIARAPAVGDNDVIKRPLLGAGACHTNNEH
jgi:hypothetical protein